MSMEAGYRPEDPGASLEGYDFALPEDRIATHPSEPRSRSRLLAMRPGGNVHSTFEQLGRFLSPGDLLVANNARVCPWRFDTVREATGARVELLLLGPPGPGPVEALCRPARKIRPGEFLSLGGGLRAQVLERRGNRCRLGLPAGA